MPDREAFLGKWVNADSVAYIRSVFGVIIESITPWIVFNHRSIFKEYVIHSLILIYDISESSRYHIIRSKLTYSIIVISRNILISYLLPYFHVSNKDSFWLNTHVITFFHRSSLNSSYKIIYWSLCQVALYEHCAWFPLRQPGNWLMNVYAVHTAYQPSQISFFYILGNMKIFDKHGHRGLVPENAQYARETLLQQPYSRCMRRW